MKDDPGLGKRRFGRRFRVVVAAAAVTGLVIAAGWGLTLTPLFKVRAIHVSGASSLTTAAVLRLAGLGPNTNVFYLDTREAEARLEASPLIRSAIVTRHLPGTLDILVRERVPVAVTDTGTGAVLVGGDGVVMGAAPPSAKLPAIVVVGAVLPDQRDLAGAASALSALSAPIRARVATVSVSGGQLTLQMQGGLQVVYGDARQPEAKAQALKALLVWVAGQGTVITSVDVSAPAAPTAELAGGGVAASPPMQPSPTASPSR